jgi:hypothetical protein
MLMMFSLHVLTMVKLCHLIYLLFENSWLLLNHLEIEEILLVDFGLGLASVGQLPVDNVIEVAEVLIELRVVLAVDSVLQFELLFATVLYKLVK